MKPILVIVGFMASALCGFQLGKVVQERTEFTRLIEAAASADGLEGGSRIRHSVIGNITNVIVMPDRVMVYGTKGSRSWFP